MAINWFEGGRRISKLCIGLVLLGGGIYVVFSSPAKLTLVTEGPDEPWEASTAECGWEAASRYLSNVDIGNGQTEDVTLCFKPAAGGKIPYAVAPTPEAAQRKYDEENARIEADDKARMERGEPPPLRRTLPAPTWYYTNSEFSEPVRTYLDERERTFQVTPQLQQELREANNGARVRGWWKAANEAFPVVAGLIAAIWAFTAVMGWIVRGFAGVPRGKDFREAERS